MFVIAAVFAGLMLVGGSSKATPAQTTVNYHGAYAAQGSANNPNLFPAVTDEKLGSGDGL